MGERDEAHRRTRRIAAGQGGVLTRAQALQAGLSPAQVRTALRRGTWTAVRYGVYVPDGPPQDAGEDLWRRVAAEQLRTPGLVAVGRTAAALHGLPLLGPPGRLQQVRPDRGQRRHDVPLVHLPDQEVTLLRGLHLTALARTAVDMARGSALLQGVVVADAVLHRGVPAADLQRALLTTARFPGARAAATALARARPGSESPLESIGRVRMVDAGLPEPALQVEVYDDRGLVGRVDHLWRDRRVVGEADGLGKYETPAVLRAEKLREDRLRDAGLEVVRYTWTEAMSRPQQLARRVRAAFARAERLSR